MNKNTRYFLMLSFLVVAAALTTYITRASNRELLPPRKSFGEFPETIGSWRRYETQTLDSATLDKLEPDDYLSQTFLNSDGHPVYLFMGYYASQRSGKTYHSPQNCLPGSGWVIARRGRYSVREAGARFGEGEINDFTIAKDDARLLTLYWYQGRGKTVASEYWGKVHTVTDAVAKHRTDGALVRVMLPVDDRDGGEQRALERGKAFIAQLMQVLPEYIPN